MRRFLDQNSGDRELADAAFDDAYRKEISGPGISSFTKVFKAISLERRSQGVLKPRMTKKRGLVEMDADK